MSNPVLGTMVCGGCGGQATVKQAKRRGQYLYTQCLECGIDQRTGKAVQNEIWHSTEWKNDVDKMQHRPANVVDNFKLDAVKNDRVLVDDWEPDQADSEFDSVSVPVKRGSGRALLAVSFLVVGLASMMRVLK